MWSIEKLLTTAIALGAQNVRGWSNSEKELCQNLPTVEIRELSDIKKKIRDGQDPLGEAFCTIRGNLERRKKGATYTPSPIVNSMVDWAVKHHKPARVIDPGVGSGRFLVEVGRRLGSAQLLGIDIDPVATIMARGHIHCAGLSDRCEIRLGDYRELNLPKIQETTLYIGNPPYVRHHEIHPEWKEWLVRTAACMGHQASQLAGLHIHFLLATAHKAQDNDAGLFITSAEWLDVNYGSLARELFLGRLGGQKLLVIEPTAQPFPDAATTGAIMTFDVGKRNTSVQVKRIASLEKLNGLEGGHRVRRDRLTSENRWSHFTRVAVERRVGHIELGELCRVHRGQVTGANQIWIESVLSQGIPEKYLYATVTRAKELISANKLLTNSAQLRRVIDLPVNLDEVDSESRGHIEHFLRMAKDLGADSGYVAKYRRAWWSVGLRDPAPILATYMARRPPAFVMNMAGARHLNIAHGLYPREPLSERLTKALVSYLSESISTRDGRTYAGGLTKFEPREMERLLVPSPEYLEKYFA